MAMLQTTIPEGYKTKLNLYDTQNAIALIKATFQEALSGVLNLKRVSAPLFVYPDTGLNDNLNGVERPVRFDAPDGVTLSEQAQVFGNYDANFVISNGFTTRPYEMRVYYFDA